MSRPTTKITNFIFGYGSLICPRSRAITSPTSPAAQPVLVHNLQRSWAVHATFPLVYDSGTSLKGVTVMGVMRQKGTKCTGVLIEISGEEMLQFDKREGTHRPNGYTRELIDLEDIDGVPGMPPFDIESLVATTSKGNEDDVNNEGGDPPVNKLQNICVWVYIPKCPMLPTTDFPIIQSYVDVILGGCLSISKNFAVIFLEDTHGWNNDNERDQKKDNISSGECDTCNWVDDRLAPLYPRFDSKYSVEMKHELDEFVGTYRPEVLNRRHLANYLIKVEENGEKKD